MLSQPDHMVRHFRDVLVWPVQIKPGFTGENVARIHERITGSGHWTPVDDEFTTDPADFQERHYKEFVAFLPYVQRFLVFLIAHFHRAALLSFSDGLAGAVNELDIRDNESVRRFKRRIRQSFEAFLRFTHRYWFHEVSEQGLVQALFQRTTRLLRNDELFGHVKDQMREMSAYLDSDSQRRQSGTVLRLTVVTIFGLIATVVTGYFGMNLFNFPEVPGTYKLVQLGLVSASTLTLVLFAVARSKRLSDFLEALSDERLPRQAKWTALGRVFNRTEP